MERIERPKIMQSSGIRQQNRTNEFSRSSESEGPRPTHVHLSGENERVGLEPNSTYSMLTLFFQTTNDNQGDRAFQGAMESTLRDLDAKYSQADMYLDQLMALQ